MSEASPTHESALVRASETKVTRTARSVNRALGRGDVMLTPRISRLRALLQIYGPYAAIALLLPGGSLVALFVWIYRHMTSATR